MKYYVKQASLFIKARNTSEVAAALETFASLLEEAVEQPDYKEFRLKKKKGGQRLIETPGANLKLQQSKLNDILQFIYNSLLYQKLIPDNAYGFIAQQTANKKTIASNAMQHLNRNYVLNMDVENFFPSITGEMIYDVFAVKPFQFPPQLANQLTKLCCYKNHLPIGAPSSPILSNFYCLSMDKEIHAYCKKNKITYTRYADDLTFSADMHFAETFVPHIHAILKTYGFKINRKKLRLLSFRGKQTVTGLVVNKKVNVDRRYIRKLRAIFHSVEKEGIAVAASRLLNINQSADAKDIARFKSTLRGMIGFVAHIKGKNDPVTLKLRRSMKTCCGG